MKIANKHGILNVYPRELDAEQYISDKEKEIMITKKIHSGWMLEAKRLSKAIPVRVPGSVYQALLDSKEMEDPFWRDNEQEALEWMKQDFIYSTTFDVEDAMLEADRNVLRFDGIDTLASVWLNGEEIGTAENMHRIYEYDVTDKLYREGNELMVKIASAVNFIEEAHKKIEVIGTPDAMEGFPQIRKAHCMFGWDWGPRVPDAGLFRDVTLLGIRTARIDNVLILQHHREEEVELEICVEAEDCGGGLEGLFYTVEVEDPDGIRHIWTQSPDTVTISHPKLWWPNGFGSQPLYKVTVHLMDGEEELDCVSKRIGLRTMTVRRQKDQWGESFAHEVNGVAIFAMGADYIPEDNVMGRICEERTRKLLMQCKAANFNAIRVWGGGYYPDDYFYDICDELGLIVWQDFMFACAVYELTDAFEENIRREFEDNIKRIRHHACLGLWCGNNEMEMFVGGGEWGNTPKQMSDYIKMYEYIIPQELKQWDPQTFYWPASPSCGGGFDEPNAPNRGDVHYWDVWHGNKPFTEYRKFLFRYASEFGFQSFPALKTVESFTLPEDRNIFSYVMEKHQRSNSGNGKIMNYMAQTFLYPTSFPILLYASQLLQAEAIRYGVEHFRRNRGCCMGAIYWQLNDCWPVASWASIDYFGRWKALHYYAKRFFAPLLLSCKEEGMLTQDTNINAQPKPLYKSVRFNVSNETMEEQRVTVKWQVRNAKGESLRTEEQNIVVPGLSAFWMDEVELPDLKEREEYVSYELWKNGEWLSEGTVIFTLPKYFCYEDPHLTCRLEGDEIVVTADAYAKSVEILNEAEDLILTDNYFDMNGGQKRVKILEGEPVGLKVRSVYDIR